MKIPSKKLPLLIVCAALSLSLPTYATGPGSGPPPPMDPPTPPGFPLDTNLMMLMVVAVIFGSIVTIKAIHKKRLPV